MTVTPRAGNETVYTLEEYLIYLREIGMVAEVELKQVGAVTVDETTGKASTGDADETMVTRALDQICLTSMENMSFIATCEQVRRSSLAAALATLTLTLTL